METIVLASPRLSVSIDPPGSVYFGSRFDWTTQVRQITFDGRLSLLTREKPGNHPLSNQGLGLAGEFGITTPIGYRDCPVGQGFPKIGVGLLTKSSAKEYRFSSPYPIHPAEFHVVQSHPHEVLIRAQMPTDRGFGWKLERIWSIAGAELSLTTTLTNTGQKAFTTEEYIHNFFGLADVDIGSAWTLSLGRALEVSKLEEYVDKESLLLLQGETLSWKAAPTQDFFVADHRPGIPPRWSLHHGPTGLSISEQVDFQPTSFHLWGCRHVVSPELFHRVDLPVGAVTTWTRRWVFQRSDSSVLLS